MEPNALSASDASVAITPSSGRLTRARTDASVGVEVGVTAALALETGDDGRGEMPQPASTRAPHRRAHVLRAGTDCGGLAGIVSISCPQLSVCELPAGQRSPSRGC